MAKPLIFRHGKSELSFQLDKLDRDKLYGYIDTEALDAASRACQLAILGGDGKTLVGRGGSALQYVDADGSYATRTGQRALQTPTHRMLVRSQNTLT